MYLYLYKYCTAPPNPEVHESKPTVRELKKRLEERRGREREVFDAPLSSADASDGTYVTETLIDSDAVVPVQTSPIPAARTDEALLARPVSVSGRSAPSDHSGGRLVQLVPASPRPPPRLDLPSRGTSFQSSTRQQLEQQQPQQSPAMARFGPSESSSSDEEPAAAAAREESSPERLEAVRRTLGNYSLQNLNAAELLAHVRAGSEPDESSSMALMRRSPSPDSSGSRLLSGGAEATPAAAVDSMAPPEPLLLALELERQRRHRLLVLKHQLAAEVTKKTRDNKKGIFVPSRSFIRYISIFRFIMLFS